VLLLLYGLVRLTGVFFPEARLAVLPPQVIFTLSHCMR
jgi:hypothetical protein